MVFPAPAAATVVALGEGDAAVGLAVSEVEEVGVLLQALRRILVPRVAEPYRRNLRRPNRLAIPLPYSWLNQPNGREHTQLSSDIRAMFWEEIVINDTKNRIFGSALGKVSLLFLKFRLDLGG
jgi:hypothetical protein